MPAAKKSTAKKAPKKKAPTKKAAGVKKIRPYPPEVEDAVAAQSRAEGR